MNHHEILLALVENENQENRSFEENLEKILTKIIPMLPQDDKSTLEHLEITPKNDDSVRFRYLKTTLFVLKSLKDAELSESQTFMSLKQQKTVRAAVEIVVSIGILPCLLPGVGPGASSEYPRFLKSDSEKLTDMQKYERLASTIRDTTNLFEEVAMRSALMLRLGPLIAALLQLSFAPLMKPSQAESEFHCIPESEFRMTDELYEKLTKDQEEFRETLSRLIDVCPQAAIVKELMIIVGVKNSPNWIRRRARSFLMEGISQPNGIISLVDAVCSDIIDLGAHWEKLDTVARLVAISHGKNPDQYYDAVCSQLINLLISKRTKHSSTIANNCITAIYEYKPDVCIEKIVRVIAEPLRGSPDDTGTFIPRNEKEVADCIETLTICFVPVDSKFKNLPCILMKEIALPLFHLHAKARQSVSHVRAKIKDLLLHLLAETTLRDDLFAAFLEDDGDSRCFGEKISCRFGPTGGLEIDGETENLDYETAADCLLDLVADDDPKIAFSLFNFLLRSFPGMKNINRATELLESNEDVLDRASKQLSAMKLLSNLANRRTIQQELTNDPEPFLDFIKSLFNERSNSARDDEDNIEVLYVSLMLVKVILTEGSKAKNWNPYDELATFLKIFLQGKNELPQQLFDLVGELVAVIKNRGRSATRNYQDLSVDDNSRKENDFEKAVRDLADPLLPVRAHGLMSLTKLIEKKDAEAVAKKDIVLCFFQENLKDEDSFVYLAAVNGLCALASVFPQKVIETLVQEYIDMPGRSSSGDITPETRAKLGEILVKTTRALGDMAPVYKNILINGFLCGTRDPDDMVRASSLSCLGEVCKVLGFKLGHATTEVIYCIGCIIDSDKVPECRRAAVLVANLLIGGLGKDVLTDLGSDLVPLYRALKFLRDNDDDQVLRLHAQLAVEELDDTVQTLLFAAPELKNRVFFLP